MKRKRLKQFLCALLTVSMVAGQPLSLLAAEEAVTEVGAEGFSDAQEAVEDVDEEQVLDAQEIPSQMSDDTDSAFSDASDTAQTDSLFGDGSTDVEEFSDSGEEGSEEPEALLSFREYLESQGVDVDSLSKEENIHLYEVYKAYVRQYLGVDPETAAVHSSGTEGWLRNNYLEAVVNSEGKFTMGTCEGNPNYDSDNNRKLLYGHPNPNTSETLIKVGDQERFFEADTVNSVGNKVIASMTYNGVQIIQTLELVKSGNASYADTVRISYQAINVSGSAVDVGIRIMLDTMLANNDDAPFRIPGVGNQTTIRTFTGAAIPQSYQVYDRLDDPTTLATGYLYRGNERRPDVVYFTNWSSIRGEYWDYDPYEGSSLGDSAVAIRFDPTTLAAGKSMEVSTYYGISVGNSITAGSGNESVGKNQFLIKVKDTGTEEYLEDVDVALTGQNGQKLQGKTDENGKILFDDIKSIAGDVDISISKDQYRTKVIRKKLKGGESMVFTLKNLNDTTPEIESVTMGDKNLLIDTVSFLEDSSAEIAKAKKTKTVKINVESDMDDCVYFLMQDESVVAKNKTGVFEFKTLEKKNGTVIEKLTSQSKRYVKCVSKDGKSSKEIQFGLKVSKPVVSAKGITKMKFMTMGEGNVGKSSLAALFMGNALKFGMNDLLDLEVKTDDNGKVSVGLNLKFMPSTQKEKEKLNKELLESKAKDFKLGKKQPKLNIGSFKTTFNVAGYGEGYLDNGKVMVNIVVRACGSVSGSHTTNFFWIVPTYISVSGEGKIEAEIRGSIINQNGLNLNGLLPKWTSGTIAPSISVAIEGGVGSKGIANFGAEGRGTVKYTADFVKSTQLCELTASASLKAAVWKFEKSLKLAEATVTVYDSNRKDRSVYCQDQNIYDELNAQPFLLASEEGVETDNGITAGSDSNPIFVNAGGTNYKFWIHEDPSKQICNSSQLVYQKAGETGYTIIDDDGTSDFAPAVAVDEAKKVIYVAWQDTKKAFDDSSATVDQMANASEICVAVIHYGSGSDMIRTYPLTDNNVTDTIPGIAVKDGVAYVAWYHTENKALETTLPGYVYYTSIGADGTTGALKWVDIGSNRYISQISVAASGSGPVVTYTFTSGEGVQALADVDETRQSGYIQINTGETGNLGTEEGSAASGIITGSLDGTEYMFWYQDGNIAYKANVNDKASYVFDPAQLPENLTKNFQVISSQTKTYILWTATASSDQDQNQKAVYGCIWEKGAFGKVHCLGNLGAGIISGLSGAFNEDGKLVLSYNRAEYDENGTTKYSDLEEKTVEETVDLKIQSVDFEDSDVASDQALPMTVTVKNNGNLAAKGIDLSYICAEKDYEVGQGHKDVVIQPGEEKQIQIDYPVPKLNVDDEPETYRIEVSAAGSGVRQDAAEFELGYRVLYVEQLDDVMMDNQECIVLQIVNDSGLETKNVGFRILADAKDGAVLYTENMGTLEPGEVRTVYFPRTTMDGSKAAYLYLATDSPRRNEEDAYSLLSNSSENVRLLTTSSFKITAGEGGTIVSENEKNYDSDTEIDVIAAAKNGYVFDHWTANDGIFEDEDSPSTTFIMPEKDVEVTALFKKEKKATGVSLPETLELSVGDVEQLNATVTPSDASDKCTYTTEQTDIISVSKKGEVEALKAGTAQIKVTCGAYSDTCSVTVKDVPVTDIRMIYPTLELDGVGAQDTVEVLLTPSNATEALTYTSDHPEIVSVDENGKVTANAVGDAEITVSTKSDVKGTCKVRVTNPLTGIQISESALKLKKNDSAVLSVNFLPFDTTEKQGVDWTIYDTDVAELVTSGENNSIASVKAISSGTTLIEASIGDTFHAYCNVTVYVPAERITLNTQNITIRDGQSYYLSYDIYPSDATDRVTFTSSNYDVADVYGDGEVYGRDPGTAVITAATESGLLASCQVTVVAPEDNMVNVTDLSQFQSDHPYANNEDRTWSYHVDGAGSVSITFSSDTETEDDFDYIYIMDGTGKKVGTYTGTELRNRTVTVSGSTIKVRLTSDSSYAKYGFRVVRASGTTSIGYAQIAAVPNQYYTGSAVTPALNITYMGRTLTAGVDYTVFYSSNINVGKATAVISGLGSFAGSATVEFYIVKPNLKKVTGGKTVSATQKKLTIGWNQQSGATGYYVYRYEKAKKKYVLRATLNGGTNTRYTDKDKKLKYGTKYRYKVIPFFIQGSLSAKGPAAVIESTLAPKKAAISRVTGGKRSLTVKYGRISRVNGYEVYVSKRKGSGYKLAATVKKGTATKATAKRLTSKKTYYVKVRAYISTKSGKVYGAYSSPKKVRVK